MNRKEFMEQLERLLQDIPESDRQDAIAYYNDYFDEVGPENEASLIQQLGSPGKVAGIIKADLESGENDQARYTEYGYEDGRTEERKNPPDRRRRGYQEPKPRSRIPVALVIVLLIFASPLLFGAGAGVIGVLLGICGGLLGIIVGVFCGAFGGLIGGVVSIVVGAVRLVISPTGGIFAIAVGALGIAVGLLFLVLFAWLVIRWLPALFRWFVDLCHRLLGHVRGK